MSIDIFNIYTLGLIKLGLRSFPQDFIDLYASYRPDLRRESRFRAILTQELSNKTLRNTTFELTSSQAYAHKGMERLDNFCLAKMASWNQCQTEVLPIISSFRDPLKPHENAKRPVVRFGVFERTSNQDCRRNDAYFRGKTVYLWFQVDSILASILWTLFHKSDAFSLNFTLWIFKNWKTEKKYVGKDLQCIVNILVSHLQPFICVCTS